MRDMTIKVAINGYGTIGKRVADAVSCQDDMEIIGVTSRPSFGCDLAVRKVPTIWHSMMQTKFPFGEAGYDCKGG